MQTQPRLQEVSQIRVIQGMQGSCAMCPFIRLMLGTMHNMCLENNFQPSFEIELELAQFES